MKKLLIVLLCLTCASYAQNAGWADYDATEFVNNIKKISHNLNIEKDIKAQIKNNQSLQLENLQDPWLEELQRLINFSIKHDKIEAVKVLFDFVESEYNKETVIKLKQTALQIVIEESKHKNSSETFYSNNPQGVGFVGTIYLVHFDIKFIRKYFNLLYVPEINKDKLIKNASNSAGNVRFLNLEEVINFIKNF